jgi:pilus assembly protein Flp/PilA
VALTGDAACDRTSQMHKGRRYMKTQPARMPTDRTAATLLRRFVSDEAGATALEYVLIASLASVAVIAGAIIIGASLNSSFDSISGDINGPS